MKFILYMYVEVKHTFMIVPPKFPKTVTRDEGTCVYYNNKCIVIRCT